VALHFQDRGPGIPPEIRDRVFEPFFTTKKSGSGIGLAVAAQAVADNGGRIYLEEARGAHAGAEFVVVFPLAAIEAPRREEVGGTGHDLFVGSVPPTETARDGGVSASVSGGLPPHLLTPEGVKSLMALSSRDPEEVN
jgi:hypothetical protein